MNEKIKIPEGKMCANTLCRDLKNNSKWHKNLIKRVKI